MLEPQDYELELPEIASPIHKLQQPDQVSLAHWFSSSLELSYVYIGPQIPKPFNLF